MNMKISLAVFALAMLLQLSHCKPTHRVARQLTDFTSKIKEYMNQFQNNAHGGASSEALSESQTSSAQTETASGSEEAASETENLIALKEGTTSSSGVPSSFQGYMPSQFSQYQNQIPSQINPSQYGQYPSQFPSQFNPSQYMPSGSSSSSSSSAAPTGSSAAASEPEPAIAQKEGSTSSSGVTSSFQSYIPSQFSQYQIPSQINPSQYGQYPSQFPSQFNPSQYMPSGSSSSSSSSAAPTGSSAAASEPEPAIAQKEGSTSSSGVTSSFQSYIPSQFSQYQIPSQINPSQYGQYPSQFPSQFNPSQYMPSGSSSSSSSSAAPTGSSTAASEPEPAIALKEGSTSSSGVTSSFQSYMPSQFSQYQIPSQINPSQYGQYPSQFPSQFNPSQYMPSNSAGASSSSSATGSSATNA